MNSRQIQQPNTLSMQSNQKFPLTNSSSLIVSTNLTQNFYSKAQSLFGTMSYHDKTVEQIEASVELVRKNIKEIQNLMDKKITKYYTRLREKNLQKQLSVDQIVQNLKHQKQLRNELIKFQQVDMKDIQEVEKTFDSKQNIELAIPIQINATKKKILELQKFIHSAQIRQKKKSEDVVKVEKVNNQQFQKIAMLRTTLEIQMISQMTINQREMKIDQKMYDFQSKIEALNEKFAKLIKVVQQKHILISSNKGLIQLKQRKVTLDKQREQLIKKIGLLKNNINKSETSIKRDIEQMKKEIGQKQTKYAIVEKELQEITKKNDSYLINANLNKSLRKSISYSYADTLLKVKQKEKLENPQSNMKMNVSLINESQSLKPNFKVKKIRNQLHSSVAKMQNSKKALQNSIGQVLLPSTLDHTKQKNKNSSFYNPRYSRNKSKFVVDPNEGLQQEIIIDD